jgi:hypothetical protein
METRGQGSEPEDGKSPERELEDEDGEAQDVEREWLGDHPELAADQSRISVAGTGDFGRGSGVLSGKSRGGDALEARSGEAAGPERRRAGRPSDWSAVLGRLGGSSPGSEENLQLAEKFAAVRFPATRDDVLRSLPPDAGFRVRSAAVDLREAIQESRAQVFQNTYDLIDAVKDEFRRAEQRETKAA